MFVWFVLLPLSHVTVEPINSFRWSAGPSGSLVPAAILADVLLACAAFVFVFSARITRWLRSMRIHQRITLGLLCLPVIFLIGGLMLAVVGGAERLRRLRGQPVHLAAAGRGALHAAGAAVAEAASHSALDRVEAEIRLSRAFADM
ncbi:MAG: hypothetical protein AAGH64_09685 [Planctomycetota bacterium]